MNEIEVRKTIAKNIRYYMNENNLNQVELSKILNVSESTVGKWLLLKTTPRMGIIEKMAEYFGVNKSDILEEHEIKNKKPIRVPVYDCVPSGVPIEALNDNVVDVEELDSTVFSKDKKYVGLLVRGDSMYPRFLDGDIIIVQIQPDCESGTDAVVYVNGFNATLKTVYKHEKYIELRPVNTNYPPQKYPVDGSVPIEILGIVKELRRKF